MAGIGPTLNTEKLQRQLRAIAAACERFADELMAIDNDDPPAMDPEDSHTAGPKKP